MEFFFDDDERYEKCIYSINRGIAGPTIPPFLEQNTCTNDLWKKWGKHASVKLCVVIADRHGEFTTHQPSPPVCLVVKCVAVKMKKKEF